MRACEVVDRARELADRFECPGRLSPDTVDVAVDDDRRGVEESGLRDVRRRSS